MSRQAMILEVRSDRDLLIAVLLSAVAAPLLGAEPHVALAVLEDAVDERLGEAFGGGEALEAGVSGQGVGAGLSHSVLRFG